MADRDHSSVATCGQCGKQGYDSRRAARRARRRIYPHHRHMDAYRCRDGGDLWHLGHRPSGGRALIRWRQERAS